MTVTDLAPIKLGGSTVPAILGLDPYVSAYAAGARLLDPTLEPLESEAMRNGLRLQVAHAEMVEDDGYQVMPAPADGFVHPVLPWLVGHPDYFVALPRLTEEGGVNESSSGTRSADVTSEVDSGRTSLASSTSPPAASTRHVQRAPLELKLRGVAPSEALRTRDTVQALVYAELVGTDVALVSELHGGYGGISRDEWTVERDAELFGMIVERCEAFLALLRRGRLPDPSGSDSDRDALRKRFAHAEPGQTVRATQDIWQHVRKVRELDEVIGNAKAQRERHAQQVQDFMGEATELVSPYDTSAARWRPQRAFNEEALHAAHPTIWQKFSGRTLDKAALKAKRPDLYAEFSEQSTIRRFEANP